VLLSGFANLRTFSFIGLLYLEESGGSQEVADKCVFGVVNNTAPQGNGAVAEAEYIDEGR
jgi:hypothetical protein